MTNPHPTIQDAKRQAFLTALAQLGVVTAAAEAAGINRVTAWRWREADEEFAKAWDDAIEQAADRIELEAHRRAVVGFEEPVVHKGVLSYRTERYVDEETKEERWRVVLDDRGQPVPLTIRRHSDALMGILLKGHKPEKYRDNSKVELSGHLALGAMSEEDIRAELAALAAQGIVPGVGPAAQDDDCSDLV